MEDKFQVHVVKSCHIGNNQVTFWKNPVIFGMHQEIWYKDHPNKFWMILDGIWKNFWRFLDKFFIVSGRSTMMSGRSTMKSGRSTMVSGRSTIVLGRVPWCQEGLPLCQEGLPWCQKGLECDFYGFIKNIHLRTSFLVWQEKVLFSLLIFANKHNWQDTLLITFQCLEYLFRFKVSHIQVKVSVLLHGKLCENPLLIKA